jgi:hypothetical protein
MEYTSAKVVVAAKDAPLRRTNAPVMKEQSFTDCRLAHLTRNCSVSALT